nr:uncharacterized protein LOC109173927 [Ipomoea batatas]
MMCTRHPPRNANGAASSPTQGGSHGQSKAAKRKRGPSFPSPEPYYYRLDPNVARTIKPRISPLCISKAIDLLGPNIEIINPSPEISIVHHCSAEANPLEVGVHYNSIKCGLRFPLHPFVSEFLNTHQIIPAQLAPNGYKFLVVFLNICKECDIPPSQSLFHYLFTVEAGTKVETQSFVTVSSRRGLKFVTDIPSSHSGWKQRFFKVRLPESQICFPNVWATRVIHFPMPEETPELLSQAKKIASVPRSCNIYASKEKIDILYGLKEAEADETVADEPPNVESIPVADLMEPKPEVIEVEEQSTKEMAEKIKALEAQVFFARQAGVEDFKKSKEFEQSALQYMHQNVEAFVGWELADEARREAFFKIVDDHPASVEKKVREEVAAYCKYPLP